MKLMLFGAVLTLATLAGLTQANAASIHEAAERGNTVAVQEEINKGVPVDTKNAIGWTPLIYAASEGHLDIVTQLIDAGAWVDVQSFTGSTALGYASYQGHTEITKRLIQARANINARSFYSNGTALMDAASRGHAKVVKVLLQAGAEVNDKDINGNTPLIWSVKGNHKGNHTEVIKELLQSGADFNATDADGRSALIWALKRDREGDRKQVIEQLLQADGIDVFVKSKYGETALSVANSSGKTPDIQQLIQDHITNKSSNTTVPNRMRPKKAFSFSKKWSEITRH